MIISRSTPAALLTHTVGLGKGWAHVGALLASPRGPRARTVPRAEPWGCCVPSIKPKPWRSARTVLPACWPQSRESWLLSALPSMAQVSSSRRWRYLEAGVSTLCSQSQHMGGPRASPAWSWTPSHRPREQQQAWGQAAGAARAPSLLQLSSGGGWDGVPWERTPKQCGIRSHCLREPPERVAGVTGCWWPPSAQPTRACLALTASFVSSTPRLPLSLLLKPSGCAGPRQSLGPGPGPGCSARH